MQTNLQRNKIHQQTQKPPDKEKFFWQSYSSLAYIHISILLEGWSGYQETEKRSFFILFWVDIRNVISDILSNGKK